MKKRDLLLEKIIIEIENFSILNKINHRFVGGVSFGGLLNDKTVWKIDIKNKIITLQNHNLLNLLRNDNTIRDIDIIVLSPEKKYLIKEYIKKISKKYSHFPEISVESPIFFKKQKNPTFQLVTSLEIDNKKNIYLFFENIKQEISWESIEPWNVVLENKIKYTVRNPIGDYFAYFFRSPSGLKPKDKEKIIFLKKLSDEIIKIGKKENIDFTSKFYFKNWEDYLEKLSKTNKTSIVIKKYILSFYWNTFGTSIAHGEGFWGKFFSKFSNQFTGSEQ